MLLLPNSYYRGLEKALHKAVDQLFDREPPCLQLTVAHLECKVRLKMNAQESTEEAEPDVREPDIKTRKGVSVVADSDHVIIRCLKKEIDADWGLVPGILATLRGALVPAPRSGRLSPEQVQTALEIASGFGGPADECLFTVEDAEDIVKNYEVLAEKCPDKKVRSEIERLQRVGPRKLFQYLENEILTTIE